MFRVPTREASSAGQAAFARSLSAGRIVVAAVAIIATVSARTWREPLPIDVTVLVVTCAALMIGREVARWMRGNADRPDPIMIVADAAMAVALLTVIGDAAGPLGWIAMILPVLEALAWSGVVAAALVWISVGGLYVVLRTMVGADLDDVVRDLVAHIGGSLLIAVPAWAASSVIGRELSAADTTRTVAEGRADQIQRLAEVGRKLAGASSTEGVLDLVAEAGVDLGFTATDVVIRHRDGRTEVVRLAGRFPQGLPRAEWLIAETIDRGVTGTGRQRDAQALHRCGLRTGVAARVVDRGERIIVRLWRDHETPAGINDREIARTIAGQAAVAWQQASVRADLEDRAADLEHEATHDALTGLANRNGLMAYLDTVGYEMRGLIGLLYVDLDGFKAVNDTLGHDAGDEVLRVASQRIAASVGNGFVARLGGDEFVVVLGVDSIEVAASIGTRIIQRLEEPVVSAGNARISGSVGVTLAPREADVHAILRAADQSMYAAKKAGGGRVAATRSAPVFAVD